VTPGPDRPLLPDKEFFTAGEAGSITQVPVHTLRYWESQFKALRPVRRASGHRRYTRGDIDTILRIRDLLRGRRLTTAGARKALNEASRTAREAKDGEKGMSAQAVRLLREVRDELKALAADLS
jgi:DNA-binding transcriptional MerR regulator